MLELLLRALTLLPEERHAVAVAATAGVAAAAVAGMFQVVLIPVFTGVASHSNLQQEHWSVWARV